MIAAVLWVLPMPVAMAVGRFVGVLGWLIDIRHRRVAMANLRAAYGHEKDNAWLRRTTRRCFQHLGMMAVECVKMARVLDPEWRAQHLVCEGLEHLRAAHEQGRGVIVATGHVGNWELSGTTTSVEVHPLDSIARPLDNPLLDEYLGRVRSLAGQRIIPKEGAVRRMVEVLRGNGILAVLMDQNAGRDGEFVEFFGRPASTVPVVAMLALKFGCPVVIGYSQRLGNGYRHRLVFTPPVEVARSGDRAADAAALTAELTRRIEAAIRDAPDQWLWLHRRWKSRPPDAEQ